LKYKVISKEQLVEANEIAKKKKWPRHFIELDKNNDEFNISGFPILFDVKMRPDCTRILFETADDLYQLDVDNKIYDQLTEKNTQAIYH
jgi:hypothetical protein